MKVFEYEAKLQATGIFAMEASKEYKVDGRKQYNRPELVAELLAEDIGLRYAADEHIYVVCVDIRYHITGIFRVAAGGANVVAFPLRDVCKKALMLNAAGIFLAHNHPAGSLHPSNEDVDTTNSLKAALDTIGIQLLDHIIIPSVTAGTNEYSSFRELGLL